MAHIYNFLLDPINLELVIGMLDFVLLCPSYANSAKKKKNNHICLLINVRAMNYREKSLLWLTILFCP